MLSARAIDAVGDTVSDAQVVWQLMSIDSGEVAFVLDSLTGLVSARAPGSGTVRARVENLQSANITIEVSPAPDSVAAAGSTQITFDSSTNVSPDLAVIVYDLTTTPGSALTLGSKSVTFSVVFPVPGSADADNVFLTTTDTVPGTDPHEVVAISGSSGQATASIRRNAGVVWPDSVVVTASISTVGGGAVAGSPIRFLLIPEHN